jgi:methylenetetrahydrofolate dehydrogenase (NADP+)/methenyltetrahydrofolate cyclohydrolase
MVAKELNGRYLAQKIKSQLAEKVGSLPLKPGLAYLAFGEDEASAQYLSAVQKACREVGFFFLSEKFPEDVSIEDFLNRLAELNSSQEIHGILIQSQFPRQLNFRRICQEISPQKDVDGIHPFNQGLLFSDSPVFIPCTAKAVWYLLKENGIKISGKSVVILGRSLSVGKPLAVLLLRENATLTICHKQTVNLKDVSRTADILIVSTGSPGLVKQDWVSPEAVVIDVGIHVVKGKVVGDVDTAAVFEKASWITPVPGGVGPVTTACLLENTFHAFQQLNLKLLQLDFSKKAGRCEEIYKLDWHNEST